MQLNWLIIKCADFQYIKGIYHIYGEPIYISTSHRYQLKGKFHASTFNTVITYSVLSDEHAFDIHIVVHAMLITVFKALKLLLCLHAMLIAGFKGIAYQKKILILFTLDKNIRNKQYVMSQT